MCAGVRACGRACGRACVRVSPCVCTSGLPSNLYKLYTCLNESCKRVSEVLMCESDSIAYNALQVISAKYPARP